MFLKSNIKTISFWGGSHEYSSSRNRLCGAFFSHSSFAAQQCNGGGYYSGEGGYGESPEVAYPG